MSVLCAVDFSRRLGAGPHRGGPYRRHVPSAADHRHRRRSVAGRRRADAVGRRRAGAALRRAQHVRRRDTRHGRVRPAPAAGAGRRPRHRDPRAGRRSRRATRGPRHAGRERRAQVRLRIGGRAGAPHHHAAGARRAPGGGRQRDAHARRDGGGAGADRLPRSRVRRCTPCRPRGTREPCAVAAAPRGGRWRRRAVGRCCSRRWRRNSRSSWVACARR